MACICYLSLQISQLLYAVIGQFSKSFSTALHAEAVSLDKTSRYFTAQ